MAFSKAGFSVAPSFNKDIVRIHQYSTGDDAIAAINTAGYFNEIYRDLSVGDVITVKDSAGAVANVLVASISAAGVVDVTDGVVVTATDSD